MQILPRLRARFGENIGVELFITPPDLGENEVTYLTTDYAAGVGSVAVDNGNKFANSEYILIGALGAEKSEIIKISTVATGTLTLATSTVFAHNRGEQITFLPYNQIAIQYSTDAGANYSALATVDIRADSTETFYAHTSGLSTYYYRVRFLNSTSTDTSQFSDGIIATGFASNSAGAIIRAALIGLGEKIDHTLTKEFLYTALSEGRTELDQHPHAGEWSFRFARDYDAGNVIPGQHTLTLPTDMRNDDTYQHLLAVRIGKDKLPLQAVSKTELNHWYEGVAQTTLVDAITSGSTTLVLTSSGDFDESGSVYIAASTIAETIDTVAYTGNTETSATLTGVTGIADSKSAGTNVWQNASFGYPLEYTVVDGTLIFSQPFSDDLAGENIWLDYYKALTDVNSDADTLDEPNPKAFVPYMRWRIKKRRNPALNAEQDDDYKEWVMKRDALVTKEFLAQDIYFMPDVPC